jgi:peptide deformylase
MALLKIARMGNEVLKKVADPVADPTDPAIATLARDMMETLEDVGGNGLAAPQVHVSKRVVVYRIAPHQIPAGSGFKPLPWTVLINPVIEPLTDEKKLIWERCLSIPGLHGMVPRYTRVRCTAQAMDGSPIERVTRGFHAMLLQHECDHLDGILYPMRMTELSTLAFNSELGDRGFLYPRPAEEFAESDAVAGT